MVRRIFLLSVAWSALLLVLLTGTAVAQDESSDSDEEAEEPASYGDTELIETLTDYDLLDEWIAASPVSPQASLLAVTNGGYLAERQAFLNSLDTWATQTESLRTELARLDAAQTGADEVLAAIVSVRDSLVSDDRLRGPASDTLVVLDAALAQIAGNDVEAAEQEPSGDPLAQAEALLLDIRVRADAELQVLNDSDAAASISGVTAFVGFNQLKIDLREVEQLVERGRTAVRPERERADQLATSALSKIPTLHAIRMNSATEIDGLSVATVDAYIRGAAGVPCSVDWALLAGIGRIESNHGRLGGASVSRSGQVSPQIFGPLLDGGATEFADEQLEAVIRSWWNSTRARVASPWTSESIDGRGARAQEAPGNGFAVIVDSDGGRLDGNDEWDRAVGPMQFLPETWSRWATDGNGDGVSDPHNLYDAAASAARFLCHLSETRGSSPSSFLLGYNDSRSYARSVTATAANLRSAALPNA